jgi:hypothetical protein
MLERTQARGIQSIDWKCDVEFSVWRGEQHWPAAAKLGKGALDQHTLR